MDAPEIVIHEIKRKDVLVIVELLAKAIGQPVKRRMLIRMVRFCRSTYDVEMWSGSGRPRITVLSAPRHSAEL